MNSDAIDQLDNGHIPVPSSRSRIRVRYAETDQMGVVYYANYLVWFEVGRTDWLREHGWSYREMEAGGFSLPVIEVQCTYRESARYDDDLEVRTNGSAVSPVRVQFTYEVLRMSDGAVLATGLTVHATLDRNGRPRRLPDRIRALLE
jgi:acyl-CoA thioester hydrolase